LSFFHDIPSQIFNVGDYRRQLCGAQMPAEWYDPSNTTGQAAREMACDAALADLLEYMQQDGVRVAAFDATNSTRERRKHVWQVLKQSGLGAKRMFVESICDDNEVRSKQFAWGSTRRRFALSLSDFHSKLYDASSYWKRIFER
jgi:6-phosphofructo-2-kinase